ncbi:MAG: RNA methyltransferase [Planctomycetes bacterium]|nr:RNA methyltransferase [Planctomycetota bacterium]
MRGGLCFPRHGPMLVGVWKNSLTARIGPERADGPLLELRVRPMDITGMRKMGWIMVEPDSVADEGTLKEKARRAIQFVGKLLAK